MHIGKALASRLAPAWAAVPLLAACSADPPRPQTVLVIPPPPTDAGGAATSPDASLAPRAAEPPAGEVDAGASAGATSDDHPAPASDAASPTSDPPVVTCKTVDDCWFDDAYHPIRRPKKLRGKRVKPCRDSEHAPSCREGRCVVLAYGC